jgi:hypothetical protein
MSSDIFGEGEIAGREYTVVRKEELPEENFPSNIYRQRAFSEPYYFEDGTGLIALESGLDEDLRDLRAHEEAHMATVSENYEADICNIEAVAHARENYVRNQNGEPSQKRNIFSYNDGLIFNPEAVLSNRLLKQWESAYHEAADKKGEDEALKSVREALKHEPSTREKLRMLTSNPYVEEFQENVS